MRKKTSKKRTKKAPKRKAPPADPECEVKLAVGTDKEGKNVVLVFDVTGEKALRLKLVYTAVEAARLGQLLMQAAVEVQVRSNDSGGKLIQLPGQVDQ